MKKDFHAKLVVYDINNMSYYEIGRLVSWIRNIAIDIEQKEINKYANIATWRLMKKKTAPHRNEERRRVNSHIYSQ